MEHQLLTTVTSLLPCVRGFSFSVSLLLSPHLCVLGSPPIEAVNTQILVLGSASGWTQWRRACEIQVSFWPLYLRCHTSGHRCHGGLSGLCACVLCHAANGCTELRTQAKANIALCTGGDALICHRHPWGVCSMHTSLKPSVLPSQGPTSRWDSRVPPLSPLLTHPSGSALWRSLLS